MTASIKPGLYEHYKGHQYMVYDVATHSEDESTLVLYRPCYGEQALWVRPLTMFLESVERDGKRVPRFRYIGPAPETNENLNDLFDK
ncbi:DUF1653 domain-containing protein [Salinimonas sediminis]|uniref:DUF1653 domain-containing protein n=1 Tax=Salinimonas sediminis TaxID=2303538 RepID=A0A346NQG7_9ALTE|nr:DUF1653 domain-containing protein [Salinimonas sediminis]AXR07774.1 DUF1653 domain-containing protein [Salinimonas sediminis]